METLIHALEQFFSHYVVALAVIIIAVGWFIWKLATRFQAMSDKVNNMDTLPCTHHNTRLNAHDTQLSDTRTILGRMEGQLDLLVKLATSQRTKPLIVAEKDFSEKQSPRRLNKNGQDLFAEIDGDKFLTNNFEFFSTKLDVLDPKTALDVENLALAVLRASSNLDIFIPIKNWVYHAPAREIIGADGVPVRKEVSLDDIMFILSIPLRDKYLKHHPEIIQ